MELYVVGHRDDKGVYIKVKVDNLDWLYFYRESASPVESKLLDAHLSKELEKALEQVRRVSYLTGWRDKSAKRLKRKWFNSCLNIFDWEKQEAGL